MGREFVDQLISVIIPVFNVENYIERTLMSVLAQTYQNIEIVTVDDCSTDHSAEIIKTYQTRYPQIVYCCQNRNQGAGIARNKALELAQGQYVAFLDGDDEWKPEKLGRQIAFMRKKDAAFCYTAIEIIDEKGNLLKGKRDVCESIDYDFLLRNTMIATSSVVVNRERLGDFRMHIRRGGQDYATWLRLLREGTMAYGIDEALVRYRLRRGSLGANKFNSIRQIWEIQTQEEQIAKWRVGWHLFILGWNSVKKYYF